MQTGLKIRELPMVVQKVNDVLKIEELNQIGNNGSKSSASCDIADIAVHNGENLVKKSGSNFHISKSLKGENLVKSLR